LPSLRYLPFLPTNRSKGAGGRPRSTRASQEDGGGLSKAAPAAPDQPNTIP
jgi:hypothetical protein